MHWICHSGRNLPCPGPKLRETSASDRYAKACTDQVVDRYRNALEEELRKFGLRAGQDIEIFVRGGTAEL